MGNWDWDQKVSSYPSGRIKVLKKEKNIYGDCVEQSDCDQ